MSDISPTLQNRIRAWFEKNEGQRMFAVDIVGAVHMKSTDNAEAKVCDACKRLYDLGFLDRVRIERAGSKPAFQYWQKGVEARPATQYVPPKAPPRRPGAGELPEKTRNVNPLGQAKVQQADAGEDPAGQPHNSATAKVINRLQEEARVQTERADALGRAIVSFCEWLGEQTGGRIPMNLTEARALIEKPATQPANSLGYVILDASAVAGLARLQTESEAIHTVEKTARPGENFCVCSVVAEASTNLEWRKAA